MSITPTEANKIATKFNEEKESRAIKQAEILMSVIEAKIKEAANHGHFSVRINIQDFNTEGEDELVLQEIIKILRANKWHCNRITDLAMNIFWN